MNKKEAVKKLSFKKPAADLMPKYNPFQTGYGEHEQKERKRSNRKAQTRREVQKYENGD